MTKLSTTKHIKKTIVPFVATGVLLATTLGLPNLKASAEINKTDYLGDDQCTLVIDKANNVLKTNRTQKSTGVCKKYVEGFYYNSGKREYYSLYNFSIENIKYSGEPFVFGLGPTSALVKVFFANTKENIKGKTMHVAAQKLNVYKSANSKSKKITSVKQYKTVKVKSLKGSWAKVTVNKKTGWVARKYLVNEVTIADVEKVVTKYKVIKRESEVFPVGTVKKIAKGKNGLKYVYYKAKYKNGKLISKKKKIWTDVINYTQDDISYIGTGTE